MCFRTYTNISNIKYITTIFICPLSSQCFSIFYSLVSNYNNARTSISWIGFYRYIITTWTTLSNVRWRINSIRCFITSARTTFSIFNIFTSYINIYTCTTYSSNFSNRQSTMTTWTCSTTTTTRAIIWCCTIIPSIIISLGTVTRYTIAACGQLTTFCRSSSSST